MPIILFAIGLLFASLWLLVRIFRHRASRTDYWDGPAPTAQERAAGQQAIISVLQECPQSALKEKYPYEWNIAQATTRYEELEQMKEQGLIDEIDYERELEKILPLIKI